MARSTVSDWLNLDRLSGDQLSTVVAHLISDTLDREVCFDELWSGRASPPSCGCPPTPGWTAVDTGPT
ncbi:MAG: hypothetical protein ACRDTF_10775 [Pseudonocardiaceae bacterium]